MSSVMRARVALVAGLIGLWPISGAAGQDIRQLTRDLDAAVARRDGAAKEYADFQAAHSLLSQLPDTVRFAHGAIVMPTSRELLPTARTAAIMVDSFLEERLGGRTSLIPPTVYTLTVDTTSKRRPFVLTAVINGREGQQRAVPADLPSLVNSLKDDAQERVMRARPTIAGWLLIPVPTDTTVDDIWRAARLDLAASPTTIAHRCYDGDLAACKAVLGLTREIDPAVAWYDSAGRRGLVEMTAGSGALDQMATSRCLTGSDRDCVSLLQTSPRLQQWLTPPASANARAALVQLAFTNGGSGSLATLASGSDSPIEALSAASKLPIDSLVAQWQRHVRYSAIRSDAFTPQIALMSIGWILAMGLLATRSSRWR
jgi:hypothetical protein